MVPCRATRWVRAASSDLFFLPLLSRDFYALDMRERSPPGGYDFIEPSVYKLDGAIVLNRNAYSSRFTNHVPGSAFS